MAQAAAGSPNRFLTLTVKPRAGQTPTERLRALHRAWNVLCKRLRRLPKYRSLQFLAIVEATERGEPHFHVLLRSPYIDHDFISSVMDELLDAPVVDIRLIRNAGEAVRYVAKYIVKAPARFGASKRYWQSRDWQQEPDDAEVLAHFERGGWQLFKGNLAEVAREWIFDGFAARSDGPDRLVGVYVGYPQWGGP